MKSNVIKAFRVAIFATIVSTMATQVRAATVTGQNGVSVSIYANPFTGSVNTFGAIGGGTVVQQGGFPVGFAVDRVGGRASTGMAALQSADATQGFMQLNAASSFTVGTVIADQWSSSYYGTGSSPNDMAYSLKLDGTTVQTGPGTPGTHPIQVTTLANTTTVSQLRLEMNLAEFNSSGTRYANMSEVILLPEVMDRVVVTNITQSAGTTAGYPSLASLYDLSGAGAAPPAFSTGAEPTGGWVGSNGSVVTLEFDKTRTIRALVFAAWEDAGLATKFNIKNDLGTIIANVDLAATDYTPMRFDTPVTTSKLTFDFFAPDDTTPAVAASLARVQYPVVFGDSAIATGTERL